MVNLTLTKEELDVVYYALKHYASERNQTAQTWIVASKVTGVENPKFLESVLKEYETADKLCDDCIKLLLDLLKH